MKTATRKLRSPLKWHGGKSYLARRIIALFPPHKIYVEPFFGGGSILLNKARAESEFASDLNENLMQFWWTLQNHPDDLTAALAEIDYSAKSWAEWGDADAPKWGHVAQSTQFLVRNRFSRGGLGRDFAWSDRLRGKRRPGGPVPGDVNAWDTIRAEMPAIFGRIRGVKFWAGAAEEMLQEHDGPDTLFYLDPPYLHETRTVTKAYAFEMGRAEHVALLETLLACKGRVFLSGYRSSLYDEMLAGWKRHEFDMPNHSGQGKEKQRRIECVWENP